MRTRLSLFLATILAACAPDAGPTGPDAHLAPIRVTAFAAGTPVATLVVEVSAADISQALLFNLVVSDGIATATLRLPPGPARTLSVRAYDDTGEITHEGEAVTDVKPGQNQAVSITLRSRAGQVPVTVTFGELSVIVAPTTLSIQAGLAAPLTATVLDVDGNILAAAVDWATSNPAFALVDAGGTVTGILPGVVTIAATYEGVAGFALVTITDGPVGSLSGTVSSAVLGPLEGITVTNGIQSAVTGADGTYLIEGLPAVFHTFTVTGVPITCLPAPGFDVGINDGSTAVRDVTVVCEPNLAGSYAGTGGSDIDATVGGFPVNVSSETFLGCTEPCAASAELAHADATSLTGTVTVGTGTLAASFTVVTNGGGTTIALVPFDQVFDVDLSGETVPLTCSFSTPSAIPVADPTGAAAVAGSMAVSCTGTASGFAVIANGTIDVDLVRSGG
jgi:hypothetical protein